MDTGNNPHLSAHRELSQSQALTVRGAMNFRCPWLFFPLGSVRIPQHHFAGWQTCPVLPTAWKLLIDTGFRVVFLNIHLDPLSTWDRKSLLFFVLFCYNSLLLQSHKHPSMAEALLESYLATIRWYWCGSVPWLRDFPSLRRSEYSQFSVGSAQMCVRRCMCARVRMCVYMCARVSVCVSPNLGSLYPIQNSFSRLTHLPSFLACVHLTWFPLLLQFFQ